MTGTRSGKGLLAPNARAIACAAKPRMFKKCAARAGVACASINQSAPRESLERRTRPQPPRLSLQRQSRLALCGLVRRSMIARVSRPNCRGIWFLCVTVQNDGYSPLIVGLGGTTRETTKSEKNLIKALEAAERAGARTRLFSGALLAALPIYDPATANESAELTEVLAAVRQADGVMIATPGYHGSVSGLIKNALDGLEGLRTDTRPYLEGRAVGCIVTADGWQGLRHGPLRAFCAPSSTPCAAGRRPAGHHLQSIRGSLVRRRRRLHRAAGRHADRPSGPAGGRFRPDEGGLA